MATVRLHGLIKAYRGALRNVSLALRDVSMTIADGELLALVGPSGSGKTTLLRLIAGLEQPTNGRIEIDGVDVTATPPRSRRVAFAFQDPALFPHWTLRRNLDSAGGGDAAGRIEEVASELELAGLLQRKPGELSGGERQLAALARALLKPADVVLLDEPLSQIDAPRRERMRRAVRRMQRSRRVTVVYVTHDQQEAMAVADRMVVLRNGEVQQVDGPRAVYERPANTFVAGFFGSPPMSLLAGALGLEEGLTFCGGWKLGRQRGQPRSKTEARENQAASRRVILGVRAEQVRTARSATSGDWSTPLTARVVEIERRGDRTLAWLSVESPNFESRVEWPDGPRRENQAQRAAECLAMYEQHEPALGIGKAVEVQIDLARVQWFDELTGENVTSELTRTLHESHTDSPGG